MSDEFTSTAEAVLRRSPSGTGALLELEWEPTLDPTDDYSIKSFVALFRAQGRSLALTPALGLLIAQQLGVAQDAQDFTAVASYRARRHGDQVTATLTCGCTEAEKIVVDAGGDSLLIGSASAFSVEGPQPLDPACVNWTAQIETLERLSVGDLAVRRVEAARLARLATSLEILGASEALMGLTVAYATDRKQFGVPIGSFQAVQQLLAAAEVELEGLRSCCDVVMGAEVRAMEPDPIHDAMLIKALAGRVIRRVSQATLQVLGAVGFTWTHDHHRYQRRGLTLDALFGSYDELVTALGSPDPRTPLRRVSVL